MSKTISQLKKLLLQFQWIYLNCELRSLHSNKETKLIYTDSKSLFIFIQIKLFCFHLCSCPKGIVGVDYPNLRKEKKSRKYVQKKESSPDTEEKIRKAFPPALRQTIFTRMTPKTEEEQSSRKPGPAGRVLTLQYPSLLSEV